MIDAMSVTIEYRIWPTTVKLQPDGPNLYVREQLSPKRGVKLLDAEKRTVAEAEGAPTLTDDWRIKFGDIETIPYPPLLATVEGKPADITFEGVTFTGRALWHPMTVSGGLTRWVKCGDLVLFGVNLPKQTAPAAKNATWDRTAVTSDDGTLTTTTSQQSGRVDVKCPSCGTGGWFPWAG